MSNEGKCKTCGFLSLYPPTANVATPKYFEVVEENRESGRVEKVTPSDFQGPVIAEIRCYKREVNLVQECLEKAKKENCELMKASLMVFEKDRQCPKWYQYTPGFSPKEHLDELKGAELEKSRRDFETQMEKRSRNLSVWISVVLSIFAITQILVTFYPLFSNKLDMLLETLNNNISELSNTIKKLLPPTNEPPTRRL